MPGVASRTRLDNKALGLATRAKPGTKDKARLGKKGKAWQHGPGLTSRARLNNKAHPLLYSLALVARPSQASQQGPGFATRARSGMKG